MSNGMNVHFSLKSNFDMKVINNLSVYVLHNNTLMISWFYIDVKMVSNKILFFTTILHFNSQKNSPGSKFINGYRWFEWHEDKRHLTSSVNA